jgi:hypothetical protein
LLKRAEPFYETFFLRYVDSHFLLLTVRNYEPVYMFVPLAIRNFNWQVVRASLNYATLDDQQLRVLKSIFCVVKIELVARENRPSAFHVPSVRQKDCWTTAPLNEREDILAKVILGLRKRKVNLKSQRLCVIIKYFLNYLL